MLKKKKRLKKKEFNDIYETGKKKHTDNFFIVFKSSDKFKVSVVAPSKKFKKAVLRNEKRRKVYNILKDNFLNNKKQAIVFWKTTNEINDIEIVNELKKVFN